MQYDIITIVIVIIIIIIKIIILYQQKYLQVISNRIPHRTVF